jgi:hypothetical protein
VKICIQKQIFQQGVCCCVNKVENTNSNRWVANHLHGLIFELKEHMNSRQDRPVMRVYLFSCKKQKKEQNTAKLVRKQTTNQKKKH